MRSFHIKTLPAPSVADEGVDLPVVERLSVDFGVAHGLRSTLEITVSFFLFSLDVGDGLKVGLFAASLAIESRFTGADDRERFVVFLRDARFCGAPSVEAGAQLGAVEIDGGGKGVPLKSGQF